MLKVEVEMMFSPWLVSAGFFSKPSLKSRNTIFTLGQRGAILSPVELEGPILVPHTAQRGDSRVVVPPGGQWREGQVASD